MTRPVVRYTAVALAGALVLALGTTACLSGEDKTSAGKVKALAKASRPDADGRQKITLTLQVERGWHIYANPVGNQELAESKTDVSITGKTRPQSVKVEYPKGTARMDKIFGKHRVYEGEVAIQAVVQRAAGDTGPLQVMVRVYACDEKQCLAPGTIKLTVP